MIMDGWFVIGEKDGAFTVMAFLHSEEDAEDASSDPDDKFDRIHIAEQVQIVG
jgi:hypothetical protein